MVIKETVNTYDLFGMKDFPIVSMVKDSFSCIGHPDELIHSLHYLHISKEEEDMQK